MPELMVLGDIKVIDQIMKGRIIIVNDDK